MAADVDRLRAGNEQLGVAVETVADGPVGAWISPIESVSNSEAGLRARLPGQRDPARTARSTLAPGRAASLRVEQRATVARGPRRRGGRGPPVTRGRLAVHAHFYQPSRLDPWTGRVPEEPSAAPFHDWNDRVDAECYRPNAQRGNLERISWDLGPTLASWLATEDPTTLDGVRRGRGRRQRDGPGLPPLDPAARLRRRSADRDPLGPARVRDPVRPPRRPGCGCPRRRSTWRRSGSPPRRASATRSSPRGRPPSPASTAAGRTGSSWAAAVDRRRLLRRGPVGRGLVRAGGDVRRRPLRARAGRGRGSSGDVAGRRAAARRSIATDGELYGHHQQFRDLFLQRLVAPDAGRRGASRLRRRVAGRRDRRGAGPAATRSIRIAERTSWSCHHGVARWSAECPDAADGRWKGPLRAALERLAGGDRRGDGALVRASCPATPDLWALRDAYVDVVVGAIDRRRRSWRSGCAVARRRGPRPRPRAARGPALAARDVRERRLVLGRPDPARDEAGPARGRPGGPARRWRARAPPWSGRLVADLALFASPSRGLDGAAIYRMALAEVGQPASADRRRRPGLRRIL